LSYIYKVTKQHSMRQNAIEIREQLLEAGFSDTQILEYLLFHYMSGWDAEKAMTSIKEEYEADLDS